nr:hypothetical protein HK105_006005 [Polyrhizophydium stewartii]
MNLDSFLRFEMPDFQVLRCHACRALQVHQAKKAPKWACKLCGEKQSLIRVLFESPSAADCRQALQQLSMPAQQLDTQLQQQVEHQLLAGVVDPQAFAAGFRRASDHPTAAPGPSSAPQQPMPPGRRAPVFSRAAARADRPAAAAAAAAVTPSPPVDWSRFVEHDDLDDDHGGDQRDAAAAAEAAGDREFSWVPPPQAGRSKARAARGSAASGARAKRRRTRPDADGAEYHNSDDHGDRDGGGGATSPPPTSKPSKPFAASRRPVMDRHAGAALSSAARPSSLDLATDTQPRRPMASAATARSVLDSFKFARPPAGAQAAAPAAVQAPAPKSPKSPKLERASARPPSMWDAFVEDTNDSDGYE